MSTTSYSGCKTPGEFNCISLGDCHLGHPRTSSINVLDGLYSFFRRDSDMADLDMVIIEGDLFDSGIYLYNEHVPYIQSWMRWLLHRCQEFNVMLRILEGTPSHDMKQSKQFEVILASSGLDVDFKYVELLSVEQHEKGFSILYVPDEIRTSHEQTYIDAKQIMSANGLDTVSFAIMHGQFEYQLPYVGVESFNSAQWQEMVDHAIFIGHIHQYSQKGKIVAAGSTDRYTHGDEKTKGRVRSKLSNHGCTFKFLPNNLAKKYVTVNCTDMTVDKAMDKVEKVALELPKGSHVRIQYSKYDSMGSAIDFFRMEWPSLVWTDIVETNEPKKDDTVTKLLPDTAYVSVSLTKDNLPDIVRTKLESRGIPNNVLQAAMSKLEERCRH